MQYFKSRDGSELGVNGSFQSKNLLVFSFVLALSGFAATLLDGLMWLMFNTDQWRRPGPTPYAILLSIVCLLVVASWLSTLVGVAKATSGSDRAFAYGWAASALAVNAMTSTVILGLTNSVWTNLDRNADARLARALVFISSVQLFVALIAAVRQLYVRQQPTMSDRSEAPGLELDSE